MVLPGLMAPIFAGGSKLVSYVYGGYQTNSNNNHDWPTLPLGTPSDDRLFVVAVFGRGSFHMDQVQLDGVNMAIHVEGLNSWGNDTYCGIASMLVPDSRTTGYLVVHNVGGVDNCFISAHTITGLESYTPNDTDRYVVQANDYDVTLSLDVPEDGCVVGVAGMREGLLTATWTNLTKQYEVNADGFGFSSAHAGPIGGASPLSIVAHFNKYEDEKHGCAVSWS